MSWGGPPPANPNWQGQASAPPPAYAGYGQQQQQQQQQQQPPPQQQPYGSAPQYGGGQAPPPAQYNNPYGAPSASGPQSYQQRQYQPPQGPQGPQGSPVPPGVDPTLWGWFVAVDQDRSGAITATELRQALMNNNWECFNEETCRLMIGMFDKNRSGTIDIHEFCALWKYIQDWKQCFDRFDTDRSGNIDAQEFHQAITTFGYNLSINFCNLVIRIFATTGTSTIKFDDFIQSCVMLKSYTDAFRRADVQQAGVISIQYEQFLEMVLDHVMK